MVQAGTLHLRDRGKRVHRCVWEKMGGFARTQEGKFESAADFDDHMLAYHIDQKEAVGLRNVLRLVGFVKTTPQPQEGKMFIIHIDN